MKPSDVPFDRALPLVGILGRSEYEAAAALIVFACFYHGDTWQPITIRQIQSALVWAKETNHVTFPKLLENPFWRPDFQGLVEAGFANGDLSSAGNAIELKVSTIDLFLKAYGRIDRGRGVSEVARYPTAFDPCLVTRAVAKGLEVFIEPVGGGIYEVSFRDGPPVRVPAEEVPATLDRVSHASRPRVEGGESVEVIEGIEAQVIGAS